MSATVEQLAYELLGLPVQERAEMAHRLLTSLEDSKDDEAEVERQNLAHALAIHQQVKDGTMQTLPGIEELRKIREDLQR